MEVAHKYAKDCSESVAMLEDAFEFVEIGHDLGRLAVGKLWQVSCNLAWQTLCGEDGYDESVCG